MQKRIVIALVIVFTLCWGSSMFAQTGIGFNGAGGGLAGVFPEAGIGTTLGFWGRVALGSMFLENLFFNGDVMYWSKGEDTPYYEWKWRAFSIMLVATYILGDMSGPLYPYVGAALGLVFSSIDADYTGPTGFFKGSPGSPMAAQAFGTTASSTDLGIRGLAGVRYELSEKFSLIGEANYHLGGIDHFTIMAGGLISF